MSKERNRGVTMGVDLKWLVLDSMSRDHNYSPTMIEVGQCREYLGKVAELPTFDPPTYVGCFVAHSDFSDYSYGDLPDTDRYGKPYRMVKAGDLAAIEYEPKYSELAAAIAYVKALRSDTWIVLHWH